MMTAVEAWEVQRALVALGRLTDGEHEAVLRLLAASHPTAVRDAVHEVETPQVTKR